MITNNVYHRIFLIRVGSATGTMFAIDVDGRQYLVTAKHVIPPSDAPLLVDIFRNGGWTPLPLTLVGYGAADADIAVFATVEQMVPGIFTMEPTMEGTIWGQDVYFLGFPYGWSADIDAAMNRGFPMPFVKKALLSATFSQGGLHHQILDGHNNPGFSGGPVVFRDPRLPLGPLRVCSVISGYRYTEEPIFSNGTAMPLAYKYNTGVILTYSIKSALDVIRANPIGVAIRT